MKNLLKLILVMSGIAFSGQELPLPKIDDSLEVIQEHVTGILPLDSELLLFSHQKPLFAKGPYKPSGKTRQERFGNLSDWVRQELRKVPTTTTIVGAYKLPKGLLLVDGRNLLTYVLKDDFQINASGSIIWDRILPYRDSIGEAPVFEIANLRKKYLKQMSEAEHKVRSMAFKEKSNSYYHFFALTGAFSAPLIEMRCSKEKPINCELWRQCSIPSLVGKPNYLRGLAFNPKTKMIAVGNIEDNSISYFNVGSCNGKQVVKTSKLNKKFKLISSLFMDESSRLWIGTEARDDYLNASIYLIDEFN